MLSRGTDMESRSGCPTPTMRTTATPMPWIMTICRTIRPMIVRELQLFGCEPLRKHFVSVIRPSAETLRRLPVRRMLVVTPFVAIAMGAAVMGTRARMPDNQIAAGVHVGELDLGGKTLSEAKPAIE